MLWLGSPWMANCTSTGSVSPSRTDAPEFDVAQEGRYQLRLTK